MGLIKAIAGAAGGVMADQWKEFFYCDAIDNDVLAVKGQKRTSKRSSIPLPEWLRMIKGILNSGCSPNG